MDANKRSDGLQFLLLVGVSVFVRVVLLSVHALDIDELFQLFASSRGSLSAVWAAMTDIGPHQHPLDYYLSHAALKITGAPSVLPWLSLFWGVAAVPLCWRLGRLVWNERAGFLAGWLLAVSLLHIDYSVRVRPYALIVFLSLLSTVLFIEMFRGKSRAFFLGAAQLLFQSAYPYAALWSAGMLAFAWRRRRPLFRPVLLSLSPSFLFLIIFLAVQSDAAAKVSLFQYRTSDWLKLPLLAELLIEFGQRTTLVAIFYAVSASVGAGIAFGKNDVRSSAAFVIGFFCLVCAAIVSSLVLSRLYFVPRYALPLLPWYLLAAAIALDDLARRIGTRWNVQGRVSAGLICTLTLLALLPGLEKTVRANRKTRDLVSGAAAALKNNLGPGEPVLFSNPNFGATFLYALEPSAFFRLDGVKIRRGFNLFLFPRALELEGGTENSLFSFCEFDPASATMDQETWGRLRQQKRRVWLVDMPINYFDGARSLPPYVETASPAWAGVAPGVFRLSENNP